MINFDDYTNENKTEHNKNWPYIPDHPYRILITDQNSQPLEIEDRINLTLVIK